METYYEIIRYGEKFVLKRTTNGTVRYISRDYIEFLTLEYALKWAWFGSSSGAEKHIPEVVKVFVVVPFKV